MLNIIRKTIKTHNLISNGDTILVALSGGADSVCLTHALNTLKEEFGITLYTAHVNHGIRGDEAVRDENFAREFSESLGIKCFTFFIDVPALAKEKNISEETAGRQVRYDFLKKLCIEYGIDKIATAHNKNDNAETILMNFIRGGALHGLGGIPFKRDNIIRPLLALERRQIEEYCAENCLRYMTDSTNNELIYTRNKIRHSLIPFIEDEFNSNFIKTVTDNAVLIREYAEYIDTAANEAYDAIVSDGTAEVNELKSLDISIARSVIRRMIKDARSGLEDVSCACVEDVLSIIGKHSGKSVNLSGGIIARIEYGKLIIEKEKPSSGNFECIIKSGCTAVIPEIARKVSVSETDLRKQDGAIYICVNGAENIKIRSRKAGDIFYPCGMTGSKKVKEYMIDRKIPRNKRNSVPVIEVNGQIAAVGSRVDRRFLFKDKGIKIEFKSLEVMD